MKQAAKGAPELRNGVAAIVNDAVITFQEVEDYTAEAVDLLRRTYARAQPENYQQKRIETLTDGLEQLIEKQLILDDFKSTGGQLPESFVDEEVKDRIRRQFGDRVTLTKTLQARGVRLESFRKRVHDDIIGHDLEALARKYATAGAKWRSISQNQGSASVIPAIASDPSPGFCFSGGRTVVRTGDRHGI